MGGNPVSTRYRYRDALAPKSIEPIIILKYVSKNTTRCLNTTNTMDSSHFAWHRLDTGHDFDSNTCFEMLHVICNKFFHFSYSYTSCLRASHFQKQLYYLNTTKFPFPVTVFFSFDCLVQI